MPCGGSSRYADLALRADCWRISRNLVLYGLGRATKPLRTPLSAAWRHSVGVMPDHRRNAREKALASA